MTGETAWIAARQHGRRPLSGRTVPRLGRLAACMAGLAFAGLAAIGPAAATSVRPSAAPSAGALAKVAPAPGAPEHVKIAEGGLPALLFRPEGPGPFPAVVALHGCGGLIDRDGQPSARETDWGKRLVAKGFVVLFPDSFGARNVGPQCRVRERSVRTSRERRADAHAARRWLQKQPFVKPDQISLMGWSNGGTTVLYTVRSERLSRPGRSMRVIGPDFVRAVALYPGCKLLGGSGPFKPRMPLLIAVGAADDWTSPKGCEQLAQEAGGAVTFISYPGAFHDFDAPDRAVHVVRGIPAGRGGSREAHAGTDPAARADIIAKVPAFLAQ